MINTAKPAPLLPCDTVSEHRLLKREGSSGEGEEDEDEESCHVTLGSTASSLRWARAEGGAI